MTRPTSRTWPVGSHTASRRNTRRAQQPRAAGPVLAERDGGGPLATVVRAAHRVCIEAATPGRAPVPAAGWGIGRHLAWPITSSERPATHTPIPASWSHDSGSSSMRNPTIPSRTVPAVLPTRPTAAMFQPARCACR
jgi:hypothetical protein